MHIRLLLYIVVFLISPLSSLLADEGMWVPLLLEKTSYNRMKERGCLLSADDIYSVNHSSIKDAVVLFGRGCTGVMVSDSGLLFTNHHCGYGAIQSFSSVEHDYLTNGFWAMSKAQELQNPSLTVSFLVRMEDVTEQILQGVSKSMNEQNRNSIIEKNITAVVKKAIASSGNQVVIKPLFNENQYFLYEYEVFKDVRLVGAPPSGIGKFGGDTDNWVWPRHTGDFSIFRVYADKNNRPAPYSPDNVPYKPKKFIPISIKGIGQNDFTMVYGYPGGTSEFMTAVELEFLQKVDFPHKINLRSRRLSIMAQAMENDPAIRIQYAAKYAGVSNSWKKWEGVERGLFRANAVEIKRNLEVEFRHWSSQNDSLRDRYGNVLDDFNKLFPDYSRYKLVNDYAGEAFLAIELMDLCAKYNGFIRQVDWADTAKLPKALANFRIGLNAFFKNYSPAIDQKIFKELMQLYVLNVEPVFQPSIIKLVHKKYKDDYARWSKDVFSKSIFADKTKFLHALDGLDFKKAEKLMKDPALQIYESFSSLFNERVIRQFAGMTIQYDSLYRVYTSGIMAMNTNKLIYPDANLTLRVAFGKVEGYHVADAIDYTWFTTIDGVIAKDNPAVYDYHVPAKLKELFTAKDFGPYADKDGKLHLCFLASNHTSGGNSGSPVFNARGELIGLNFDRNWEGTMNDMLYDPQQCRNISLDIRYLLFVIDKYAGAGYLLKEMKILN